MPHDGAPEGGGEGRGALRVRGDGQKGALGPCAAPDPLAKRGAERSGSLPLAPALERCQ